MEITPRQLNPASYPILDTEDRLTYLFERCIDHLRAGSPEMDKSKTDQLINLVTSNKFIFDIAKKTITELRDQPRSEYLNPLPPQLERLVNATWGFRPAAHYTEAYEDEKYTKNIDFEILARNIDQKMRAVHEGLKECLDCFSVLDGARPEEKDDAAYCVINKWRGVRWMIRNVEEQAVKYGAGSSADSRSDTEDSN